MRIVVLLLILGVAAAALYYFFPESAQALRQQLPGQEIAHKTDRLYKWKNASGDWQYTDTPPPSGTGYQRQDYRDDVNVLPVPPALQPQH